MKTAIAAAVASVLRFVPTSRAGITPSLTHMLHLAHQPTIPGRQFHSLSDGRKICHDCCKYLVLDSNEAQGVVKEVWKYMRDIGINLPEIPVYLVESPVLNEQCNAHKKTDTLMHGNKPVKGHVTRGLCLSEVSQIRHMVRTGKHAVPRVASIQKTRSVNAILILHGLPYDLTASVLAHEATHAFIKLSDNFPDSIPPKVEEGMCQLMSYLFLKYKHMMERKDSKKRTYEGRLRKFYMQQLKNDISTVYGDGFREAALVHAVFDGLAEIVALLHHDTCVSAETKSEAFAAAAMSKTSDLMTSLYDNNQTPPDAIWAAFNRVVKAADVGYLKTLEESGVED
ncbi:hypothetical protein ON010_g7963 [Phytophthora cinnamomi]|nr:hypothetical protein ON010_g7963 [Phytophthora cinnamomi]